jgi:hypothetical protein
MKANVRTCRWQSMTLCMAIVVGTDVASACASGLRVPPELRRRAAATPILTSEQIGTRKFEVLAEVTGRSCVREPGADPSIEIAREELKIRAAALDADAVTSTLCRARGLDVVHSCRSSIECRGDAIKWVS